MLGGILSARGQTCTSMHACFKGACCAANGVLPEQKSSFYDCLFQYYHCGVDLMHRQRGGMGGLAGVSGSGGWRAIGRSGAGAKISWRCESANCRLAPSPSGCASLQIADSHRRAHFALVPLRRRLPAARRLASPDPLSMHPVTSPHCPPTETPPPSIGRVCVTPDTHLHGTRVPSNGGLTDPNRSIFGASPYE